MIDDDGGEARAGRRSNGLRAAAYAVLAECEPQLVDALLEALRTAGVAAYAAPYAGSVGGYLEVRAPDRPLARVWVDAISVEAARGVLARERELTLDTPDEEATWREIVAALRLDGSDGPPRWPTAEEVPGGGPPRVVRRAAPAQPERPRPLAEPAAGPVLEPVLEPAPELADEHFEPPPPPPLPRVSSTTAYGVAAILAGALVLLIPTMAGDPVGPALLVLAIAAVLGGFATLVLRMHEGSEDSGPDDGAVV